MCWACLVIGRRWTELRAFVRGSQWGAAQGRRVSVEEGSFAVVDLDDGWPARSQVGSEARGRITYGPCG